MSTLNLRDDLPLDDDDTFGDVEARPLFGWLLMAMALVAMAFLVGGGGATASAGEGVSSVPQQSTAVAAMGESASAAGMAFGG